MPLRRGGFWVLEESTAGTAEAAPSGGTLADVMHYLSLAWSVDGESHEREVQRGDWHGAKRVASCGRVARATLETEVKASSAAGTAPEIGKLLKGAGFSEVVTPATSVVYALGTDPLVSTALYGLTVFAESGPASATHAGQRNEMHGARVGNVKFSWKGGTSGAPVRVSCALAGIHHIPIDIATGTDTDSYYDAGTPLACFASASPLSIHGYAAILREWELTLGLVVVPRPSGAAGAADFGHKGPFWLAMGGAHRQKFVFEVTSEAVFAAWAKAHAATAGVTQLVFEAGSRKLTFDCAQVDFDNPVIRDDSLLLYEYSGNVSYADGGNDVVKLTFV